MTHEQENHKANIWDQSYLLNNGYLLILHNLIYLINIDRFNLFKNLISNNLFKLIEFILIRILQILGITDNLNYYFLKNKLIINKFSIKMII